MKVPNLRLSINEEEAVLKQRAASALQILPQQIQDITIIHKSLDARKRRDIHFRYTVEVCLQEGVDLSEMVQRKYCADETKEEYHFPKGELHWENRPIVVGFGPAGMFAALLLARRGAAPIVLERGEPVELRTKTVRRFWQTGELNTESNVQFGEGGAGTFSDGKLTARGKDVRGRQIFMDLVKFGAPKEILYSWRPHIGTDGLKKVVKNIREEIKALGGEFHFGTKVTGVRQDNGGITGVELNGERWMDGEEVILAIGHSARDTFEMLSVAEVSMEQKPFAVGVRIEHPQHVIDMAQFGSYAGHKKLGSADYQLTYTTKAGRGVYTFCMCPGGVVAAASSENNKLAINGMSEYRRNGKNANSAIVVQVYPEDFGDSSPLGGIAFQRELEEKAFLLGGGNYHAPAETVGSFLHKGTTKRRVIHPSYQPGVVFTSIGEIFPKFVVDALQEAIPQMGKKLRGFDMPEAILTAVESRTSSPVRILRNPSTFESVSLKGLYPTGEGAGYAGGIVSAAVDGMKAAEKILEKHSKPGLETIRTMVEENGL